MTRAEIVTAVEGMIGPSSPIGATTINEWVNEAYMYMVDEITKVSPEYFTKSQTTSLFSGQQEYDLPSDWERMKMVNIQYESGVWVKALPMQEGITQVPTLADTSSSQGYNVGEPQYYIINEGETSTLARIGFMPIPSTTISGGLKVWYIYTPSILTTDSSTPAIPTKYHHIIKHGAYANWLDRDERASQAIAKRSFFEKSVESMVEAMFNSQEDQPKSIVVSQGHDLYYSEDELI